jgi:hypothetical protein
MTETTKNALISMVTSILLGSACAAIGAKLGLTGVQWANFVTNAAPVIVAAVVAVGATVYKMLPKSNESILKGATEVPGVQGVIADPAVIASSKALVDNPKVVSDPAKLPESK